MYLYRNTKTGAFITVNCKVNGNWELVKVIGANTEKPKKETVVNEDVEEVKEVKKATKKKK